MSLALTQLLHKSVSIDVQDADGNTPLAWATGSLPVVTLTSPGRSCGLELERISRIVTVTRPLSVTCSQR